MRKIGIVADIDKPVTAMELSGIDFVILRVGTNMLKETFSKIDIDKYFDTYDRYVDMGLEIYGLYVVGYSYSKYILPSFALTNMLKERYGTHRLLWYATANLCAYYLGMRKVIDSMSRTTGLNFYFVVPPKDKLSSYSKRLLKKALGKGVISKYHYNTRDSARVMHIYHDSSNIRVAIIFYPERRHRDIPNSTGMVFNSILHHGPEFFWISPPPPKKRLRSLYNPHDFKKGNGDFYYSVWKYGKDLVIEYKGHMVDASARDALFLKIYLKEKYAKEKGLIKES